MLGQFGSEGPAAEEATGKDGFAAPRGDKAFSLSASQRGAGVTPGVLASASRRCFTA